MPKPKAMLIDIKKCIGCGSCAAACKQLHRFNTEPEPTLSGTALTVLEPRGDKFVRKVCMHCNDPACASACPGWRNQQDRVGASGVRRRQMHRLPLLHVGLSISGATLSVEQAGAIRQEVRSVLRARKGRQSARMHGSLSGASRHLWRSRSTPC